MVVAVLSDLHGIKIRFQKARHLVESERITHVLLAGDLAASLDPDGQRQNVKENFELLIRARTSPMIFAIPGNDDWTVVEKTLREFPDIIVPLDKAFPFVDELVVVGYPFVPITPFFIKDYEKWDDDRVPRIPKDPKEREESLIHHRINVEGNRSHGMEIYEFRFDPDDRADNIAADLKRVASLSDPRSTLYLFHAPPKGFHDFGISGEGRVHIGSRAVRHFIEKHEPWLTIHGHSHEAVNIMNGESTFTLGRSIGISVGPGNDPSILEGVLLDPVSRKCRRFKF